MRTVQETGSARGGAARRAIHRRIGWNRSLQMSQVRVPRRGSAGSGFTLIELLVVVSLIVILAGLLLPAIATAHGQAQRTTCLSNLRQIGMAQRLYVDDWDERFPHWWHEGPAPSEPAVYWTEFLHPYLRSDAVLHDPGTNGRSLPEGETLLADYSLLTWSQSGHRDDPAEPRMRWPGPPLTLANVVHPSETLTLIDGQTTTRTTTAYTRRHAGGVNSCCVDGHARWMSEAELWRVDRDDRGYYWLHYGSADR